MNKKLIQLFTLSILAFSALTLRAQTVFDVEMVFFKRIGDLHQTGQQEPIRLGDTETSEYSLTATPPLLPQGYAVLNRSQKKLEGVYQRLRSSSDMRPLLHIGWRQELDNKSSTPWLTFNLQDTPELTGLEGFDGIIRLSRNQGLLLESRVIGYKEVADLTEDTTPSSESIESVDNAGLDLPFSTEAETELEQELETEEDLEQDSQMPDELSGFFEMSETIKVKLGKLYYIDHPTMGLLVKVTPYQASLKEQESLN